MTVGQVFTPVRWARWVVEENGIVRAWLEGATVLDPTAGDGAFLEALIASALAAGVARDALPVDRLFAIERDPTLLPALCARLRERYGVSLPRASLIADDVLETRAPRCDVLVGNPPWINFAALPDDEKQRLKRRFRESGLAAEGTSLLWGSSRTDLAALIVVHAISALLRPGGVACFFLPLGLYLNDGASRGFRRHDAFGVPFALRSVHDFRRTRVFPKVRTRYGLARFERDARTSWPVPYWVDDAGDTGWTCKLAAPVDGALGPLSIEAIDDRHVPAPSETAPAAPRPRQGVNPCGATEVFVFDRSERLDDEHVVVGNRAIDRAILPRRYVVPVVTPSTLAEPVHTPRRWMLVPHDPESGRPLPAELVAAEPALARYLALHEARLRARRGPVLRRFVDAGRWWALLGVGPYSYAPFKVLWQAYGARAFAPVVLDNTTAHGCWQGNQAMHAYVPASSRDEADALLERLRALEVDRRLAAHRMEGTRSWAQPGAIARLLAST